METPCEKRDLRFRKFRAKDPSLTFGRFMAERMRRNLASGEIVYREALAELRLVRTVLGKPSVRNGFETTPIDFEFRRA